MSGFTVFLMAWGVIVPTCIFIRWRLAWRAWSEERIRANRAEAEVWLYRELSAYRDSKLRDFRQARDARGRFAKRGEGDYARA